MSVFTGGFSNYGHPTGILMTDTTFPRIPGDVGNASTYRYPVLFHVVKGATPRRVVGGDASILEPVLEGARYPRKAGRKGWSSWSRWPGGCVAGETSGR